MQTLTFLFAFIAVLALIGVAAWLVRRFANNRLGANTQRGRMPRLAVIDAAPCPALLRRGNPPPRATADAGTSQRSPDGLCAGIDQRSPRSDTAAPGPQRAADATAAARVAQGAASP